MHNLIAKCKRLFTSLFFQNQFKIQTFTYFLPAPSPRKSGYREKQFDKLFYQFINKGYKILDFKTEQCLSQQNTSGIWLIFIIQATNYETNKLNLDSLDFLDSKEKNEKMTADSPPLQGHISTSGPSIELPKQSEAEADDIEGLYYIKDK